MDLPLIFCCLETLKESCASSFPEQQGQNSPISVLFASFLDLSGWNCFKKSKNRAFSFLLYFVVAVAQYKSAFFDAHK